MMESFDFRSSEMMEEIEDRDVWRLNLELPSRNPHGQAGNEKRERNKILETS